MTTIVLTSADIKDLLDGITLERGGDVGFRIRLELVPREVRVEDDDVEFTEAAAHLERVDPIIRNLFPCPSDEPEEGQATPGPEPSPDAATGPWEGKACPYCSRFFKYEKSYGKHVDKCPARDEVAAPPPSTSPVPYDPIKAGSLCCRSTIHEGAPHDTGNKYCDACGEPCLWSAAGALPAGKNKSFTCRGMDDCPRLTEYRDGYCEPCFRRQKKERGEDGVHHVVERTPSADELDVLDAIRGEPEIVS